MGYSVLTALTEFLKQDKDVGYINASGITLYAA